VGLRLDDGNLSFKDLHAFIYTSPPGSAIFNAAEKGWDTIAYLTAATVDILAILAWQNTEDARERFPRHRPKPIPRPDRGDKPEPTEARLMGGMSASVMSVEEFQRRIEERRASRGA
jgi:hypothetical protein